MKVDLEALEDVQKKLSEEVIVRDEFGRPLSRIAGIDLAFIDNFAITACVTTSFPPMKVVSNKILVRKLDFPYIPALLGFREGPSIIEVINSMEEKPYIFLINAQGLAHPQYCGCASHVGVLTGEATIGVATSNLCGEYEREPREVGDAVAMYFGGRQVGWVLKSKEGCKPIFISPGHKIGLDSCLKVVKECIVDRKLPEPVWLAHRLANNEKRRMGSLKPRV